MIRIATTDNSEGPFEGKFLVTANPLHQNFGFSSLNQEAEMKIGQMTVADLAAFIKEHQHVVTVDESVYDLSIIGEFAKHGIIFHKEQRPQEAITTMAFANIGDELKGDRTVFWIQRHADRRGKVSFSVLAFRIICVCISVKSTLEQLREMQADIAAMTH